MRHNFFSDFVTSHLQPDPLYFSTQTSNTVWPSKIYQQKTGIGSLGICSSMCSLDPGTCQLFVYNTTSGICYLGQIAASTSGVTVNTALSSIVYTRMCKTISSSFIPAFINYLTTSKYSKVKINNKGRSLSSNII